MTYSYLFPEIADPEDCLFPVRLKDSSAHYNADASQPSPGDAFLMNARTHQDLEPLVRVLVKNPQLRDSLYKALQAEGAFGNPFAKSSK